jgi:uncharacterized coiled-coil protein SlyX
MRIRFRPLWLALLASGALGAAPPDALSDLQEQVAKQQREIGELKAALAEQKSMLERLLSQVGQAPGPSADIRPSEAPVQAIRPTTTPPAQTVSVSNLDSAATPRPSLAGFQFSGDFRYRLDLQMRSANDAAPALQNSRARYRVRFNIDKALDRATDPKLRFHLQLSTGPYNVGTTNDQDFGGMSAKHPFSVAEAYIHYAPTKNISLRGGRTEEVFADNMRFLWDDDVRFNGFQQSVMLPVSKGPLGITSVELRAGEYILSNPNITALASTSPYAAAGYAAGGKVRDAALFHPGVIVKGGLGPLWSHFVQADVSLYHNPNQIQLASTSAGYPVVISSALGLQLSGPLSASGNPTTTAGGAVLSAPHYQIAHLVYRLERKAVRLGSREMPLWFDFQASRNVGTSKLRDAVMASANLGAIRKFGDMRFLYQFAIKDANSVISQFTDDDLGTGSGVNIAVHAIRFDVGLTRYLQWQNLLFYQTERRANNPADRIFVVLQRGANPTFRFLGQLAFSF